MTTAAATPTVFRGVRVLGGAAADVVVADGHIASIDARAGSAAHTIDCDGLVMLPAFVDLHTHLREPGGEEAETIATGTAAAAMGGYSDVFAMANCAPATDSPDRVRHIARVAHRAAACRVHPVGAISRGLAGERLAPIGSMAAAGVRMFSDDGHCVDDAALLRAALLESKRAGTVIAQHAQCADLAHAGQINEGAAAGRTGLPPWPPVAEESIVARDVMLARDTGAHLHICHVSTAGTVEVIRWAKHQGWPVTAEVTPHHLLLDDAELTGADATYKVNPPLRATADAAALRAALLDGTIDAVATDHAPHTARRKANPWCDAPFGMVGLDTAFAVVADVLTGAAEPDWSLLAAVMAHRPARIGGIDDRAGRPLLAGEPATFVLVDPAADWLVDANRGHSKSANTPFDGRKFACRAIATIHNGRVVADHYGILGDADGMS